MIRAALLALMLVSSASGATTITLRDSASISAPLVTIGDVADVVGDDAVRLRAATLFDGAPASGRVSLDDLRVALEAADVNWGRVALRGGECRLRRGAVRLAPALDSAEEDEPLYGVIDLDGPETPRRRIARLLAELYGVENGDLRVRFDASDGQFLDEIASAPRYEAVIGSGSASERAPVQVIVYEGDTVLATRTVRADVRVRRDALLLTRTLERGERFDAKSLKPMSRWVSPAGSPLVSEAGGAVGQLARTRLGAGTVLREAHLDRPVLIRRNDLVTVHCLSGSVSLRVEARAQEDGREGDVIEFRKGRRGEPFRARVSGAGFAVATDETEATR